MEGLAWKGGHTATAAAPLAGALGPAASLLVKHVDLIVWAQVTLRDRLPVAHSASVGEETDTCGVTTVAAPLVFVFNTDGAPRVAREARNALAAHAPRHGRLPRKLRAPLR